MHSEDVTNNPKEWDKFWYESQSEGLEYAVRDEPVEEDLIREHLVSLTEGEISTILYYLDGLFELVDAKDIAPEVDSIYAKLETCYDD